MTIALVGGPADGRQFAIPNDEPPFRYYVPIERPLVIDLGSPDPPDFTACLERAEYEPLLVNGWLSRADDGAIRYRYAGTPEPPHPGQRRPTPTLDELAGMYRDPPRTCYPTHRAFLLACRTRYSLERDSRLNEQEQRVAMKGFMDWAKTELAKRRTQESGS
jgi:hypothetical protein